MGAYSQCYLHDTSICPEGWTFNDNISACTNKYTPLTSIIACATKLEACDLLAYCGLPSDFELATSTSFYFATVLKNVVEADDCPPGWSYRGSDCVKQVTSHTPEYYSPSYGGGGNDNQSNGAASSRNSSTFPLFAMILATVAAFIRN